MMNLFFMASMKLFGFYFKIVACFSAMFGTPPSSTAKAVESTSSSIEEEFKLLVSGKFLFCLCFELLRLQKRVFESTSSSRGGM
ncbi:MAG: hypothetical protein E7092_04615 [Bacteroidales bacterium]|nr:hypothetical protein [Bacteroidales bacterium]